MTESGSLTVSRRRVTDARVPSECAIAASSASVAACDPPSERTESATQHVPARGPGESERDPACRRPEVRRHPLAVGLAVVEEEHTPQPEVAGELGVGGGLLVLAWIHPRVAAHAAGIERRRRA